MLTEEQAREKQCRQPGQWGGLMCSASKCMAWRWGVDTRDVIDRIQDETGETRVKLVRDYRAKTGAGLKEAMDAVNAEFPPRSVGYCGAFGRPGDAP